MSIFTENSEQCEKMSFDEFQAKAMDTVRKKNYMDLVESWDKHVVFKDFHEGHGHSPIDSYYATAEWEANRQKYNNAAEAAGREIHPEDTFFAREKYILHADTTTIDPQSTVRANTVNVYIVGTSFGTQLIKTGTNVFDGDLWDPTMLNWDDRTVDFLFEVVYSNGAAKTDTVRTYIKDDEYWRLHLEF